MRQIILDTETTGLEPSEGHRVIEIGCVELVDRRFTGNDCQFYINPQRAIDDGAQAIHGITAEFLATKPTFAAIADEFLRYVAGTELVIHNAPFDVGFLNHELNLLGINKNILDYAATVFDTLKLARKLHPGQRNNLDALCKRYKIDNTKRTLHGALLDARLLAELYLAMTGGQTSLFDQLDNLDNLGEAAHDESSILRDTSSPATATNAANQAENIGGTQTIKIGSRQKSSVFKPSATQQAKLKVQLATPEELALHQGYIEKLQKKHPNYDHSLWE
jgi:DNA polymerase III subunit epsilon